MISLFYRENVLVMDNFADPLSFVLSFNPIINVDIIQGGLVRVAHYSLIGAEHGATENPIRLPNRLHLSHVKGQRGKRG